MKAIFTLTLTAFLFISPFTNAQTLNSWMYAGGALNGFGDALVTSDNNLLLSGYNRNDSVNSFFIGKWSFGGDQLWSHAYTKDSAKTDAREYQPKVMLEVEEGYLMSGYWGQNAFLCKHSKEGDLLWLKTYSLDILTNPKMQLTLMCRTTDGRIVINGKGSNGTPENSLVLLTVDSIGNIEKLRDLVQRKSFFRVHCCQPLMAELL